MAKKRRKSVQKRDERKIIRSPMKVCHWSVRNTSGMFRMAESFVEQEKALGIDSIFVEYGKSEGYDVALDADIHVCHTHIPDSIKKRATKPYKVVWVAHGSVEHVFTDAVICGTHQQYGAADNWMLSQYWLQHADAVVTFWPRQQAIWQSMCDKNTKVNLLPMGVEKDFWKPIQTGKKYMGKPSVFTAENCHYAKWPLDLLICWPWVYEEVEGSFLHCIYLPTDKHRWFFSLVNRNGAHYHSVMSALCFGPEMLRNAFCSNDYYIGLVRYGDFNKVCLEANACGAKTISYRGNPYSDFWITEGDQRDMARELIEILKGNIEPRKKDAVPSAEETTAAMVKVYEGIL
jgi:hypothetical protein